MSRMSRKKPLSCRRSRRRQSSGRRGPWRESSREVDDDRASLADAAASRCRARADVVRDALVSAHREFTARGTLDEPLVSAALDAFDGRIARAVAHDAPALGGFVDATEAQLLKRNHGAALSSLLAFARATAVARSRLAVDVASSPHGARVHETTGEGGEGGPGAALELMLLFPRAERTRAALLAHYSDELTRCLDGIDGASREGTRLAGTIPEPPSPSARSSGSRDVSTFAEPTPNPTRRRSTRSSAC